MTQLSEAVETYMYVISSLSQHTIISYRDKVQVFSTFCEQENIDLKDITPKVFLRWVSSYEDDAGCIKASSLKSFSLPKLEQKVKPTLTPDEISRLYIACKNEETSQLVNQYVMPRCAMVTRDTT